MPKEKVEGRSGGTLEIQAYTTSKHHRDGHTALSVSATRDSSCSYGSFTNAATVAAKDTRHCNVCKDGYSFLIYNNSSSDRITTMALWH